MNVVVITGSAHRRGTSALLADKFTQGALQAGHEVFRFDAALKNVHGCIGCNVCNSKGECVFKDDMLQLNPHILEADVIAFFSPIYYYNINGQMKTVIDRFFANNRALQGGKKAILFTTMADVDNRSAEAAQVFFKHYTSYMMWESLGCHSAVGVWTLEQMENSSYPQQAFELGKSL